MGSVVVKLVGVMITGVSVVVEQAGSVVIVAGEWVEYVAMVT